MTNKRVKIENGGVYVDGVKTDISVGEVMYKVVFLFVVETFNPKNHYPVSLTQCVERVADELVAKGWTRQ